MNPQFFDGQLPLVFKHLLTSDHHFAWDMTLLGIWTTRFGMRWYKSFWDSCSLQPTQTRSLIVPQLVGGLVAINVIFPYIGNIPLILGCDDHPNWRSPSFFRGVFPQPPTSWSSKGSTSQELGQRPAVDGSSLGCCSGVAWRHQWVCHFAL